uniref:DUF3421 domain-containing protein n=1 Tax=Steinernema glaseri TaxID=37863 RepID=A0A1I8AT05_9BILA
MQLTGVFLLFFLFPVSALIDDHNWIQFKGRWSVLSEGTVFPGVSGFLAQIGERENATYGHAFFSRFNKFCARYVTSAGELKLECDRFKVLGGDNYQLTRTSDFLKSQGTRNPSNLSRVPVLIHSGNDADGVFYGWADLTRSEAAGITRHSIVYRLIGRRALAKRCRVIQEG